MSDAISHHTALVYTMVIMSASDGSMSEKELRVISELTKTLPSFHGFDHSRLPVTNVNTVTFDIDALDRDFDLTWLYVEKTVEDRTAVQIEHLYHEASATLPTTYLQVLATGPRGRFLPVKRPADLDAAQPVLRELLASPPLQ